jgi:RND family efflux transporter MFP subunit
VAEESLSMAESGPSAEMIRVAEAQVQQARVAGEIAESQRDNLVITAPFAGYITAVRINEGEMAAPGMPLIGLADLGKFFACGYVGQDLAAVLSPGAKATVNVGTGGDKIVLAGEIVAVSPSADPVLKTYLIKVLCFNKNNKLKGGMMGEALLTLRRSGAGHPAVPRDAILEESGRTLVYVAARGKAVARSIVTGVDDGAMVEIISGVSPGDRIVVAGQHLLQDGAPVEVK